MDRAAIALLVIGAVLAVAGAAMLGGLPVALIVAGAGLVAAGWELLA